MPLGSFRNTVVGHVRGRENWLRLGKAPRPEYRSISELNTSDRISGFVWEVDSGGDLARFLDPSPRSCHWVRFVIRSSASSEEGELASFGESSPPGGSLYFGTQHIRTDQWVRLASRFGGDLARFLDPSPRSCHWVRFVIRSSASSEGGERIGFVRGASGIGFVRGTGACGLAHVVDQYELSKSSTREDSSFIIGGRRERVPRIR